MYHSAGYKIQCLSSNYHSNTNS